jgi:endogenous inhibitor of DNA gyrase (YacG/DUF329 family)
VNATIARNRRQNGSESKKALCLVCGTEYVKYRRWQTFCSDRCRKRAWLISQRVGAYTDVRQDIASMKESLAAIEAHLGLKG